MVRKVLSKYGESPPVDSKAPRKISTKEPINPVSEVLQILEISLPKVMTKRSIKFMQSTQFDDEELRDVLKYAIEYGRYIDSEWCEFSETSPWFACDSYQVKQKEYISASHKELEICYFLKFCIHKSGNLICTLSFHFS